MFLKRVLSASVAVLVLAAGGCSSMGGGADNEAMIMSTLETFKAGIEEGDVAKIMSAYSDNFMASNGTDKAAAEGVWTQFHDQGYLDGATVILDEATITIDGDTATTGPIGLSGAAGRIDLRVDLQKEADGWLITSGDEW